jgi:hypothetical protein
MGFSLNIKISLASAPAVTALWDAVSAFEDQPSMRALGYPPHFTFAIYDTDDVSEELRQAAIERATTGECELRLTFNRVRTFAGPPAGALGSTRTAGRAHADARGHSHRDQSGTLPALLPAALLGAPLHIGNGHPVGAA